MAGPRSVIGVDLGQKEDYTAIAVINTRHDQDQVCEIVALKRLPVGTTYTTVVETLLEIKKNPQLRSADLVVDATGVGRPVVDFLWNAGLCPVAVSIHGGDSVSSSRDRYLELRVPKRDLIANLQVLVQNRLIRINPKTQNARLLANELQNIRVRIDPRTAHDSYGAWREGEHDDLVLAVAIAAWYARYIQSLHIRSDSLASEYWKVRYFVAGV
ncbi:MAG: hypothetical protein N3G75_06250 [Methanothrix sp.]|nr:hypothetical protein [Methanothrix sp.]MCX8207416.1 hypothetical protein [Methanothrix sp.]